MADEHEEGVRGCEKYGCYAEGYFEGSFPVFHLVLDFNGLFFRVTFHTRTLNDSPRLRRHRMVLLRIIWQQEFRFLILAILALTSFDRSTLKAAFELLITSLVHSSWSMPLVSLCCLVGLA